MYMKTIGKILKMAKDVDKSLPPITETSVLSGFDGAIATEH